MIGVSRYNPSTKYGQRKAREVCQAHANKVGRKVYLQVEYSNHGRVFVAIADGRGPLNMGDRWWEFYPESNPDGLTHEQRLGDIS